MSTPPIIGSKYTGPCFDRPALRQMLRHWVLEESKRDWAPRWYRRPERWWTVAVVLLLLIACAQTFKLFLA